MTIETMFFYVMCGIIFVLSGMAFYYLRLYRNKLFLVEKEYQNAKNIIRNIVITFKKRQEDHENKIEDILYNIEKLSSILSEDVAGSLTVYTTSAFIHISTPSVEKFEEDLITPISEAFDIVWQKEVEFDEIKHSSSWVMEEENFTVHIIVRSKPTDSCRITKIPTGRMIDIEKITFEKEPEYDYVLECSDD